MVVKRNVGLFTGLKYRGGSPMLVWLLHRISGLGIIIFVTLHMLAGLLIQQYGGTLAVTINTLYESIYFQVFIYFCVIFHTLNGLRIVIMDIWPKLLEYQREVIWLEWLIFVPTYGLVIFVMISNAIKGG
jgi:succinate dehydrogenase / fumarate reductase cytochrome b subunit